MNPADKTATTGSNVNTQMCACPPNLSHPWTRGQIHNPGCPLNPARSCTHCHGTGFEPLRGE